MIRHFSVNCGDTNIENILAGKETHWLSYFEQIWAPEPI